MIKYSILFILSLFIFLTSKAQNHDFDFEHITIKEGLLSPNVTSITKDKKGYMWFGTDAGINKFDGYDISTYINDPKDSTSIISNDINILFVDSKGDLWVGSKKGLSKFNRATESFTNYSYSSNKKTLVDYEVLAMTEDNQGILWVGSNKGILKFFSEKSKEYLGLATDPQDFKQPIKQLLKDKKENIWIVTNQTIKGTFLYKYDIKNKKMESYDSKNWSITSIHEDINGNIWLSCFNLGIVKLDPNTKATKILPLQNYNKDMIDNPILHIGGDQNGLLYLSTMQGLCTFNHKTNKLFRHIIQPNNPYSINSILVNITYVDEKNIAWVGTRLGGVNKYDPYRTKFNQSFPIINKSNDPLKKFVKAINEDKNGNLWLGTDRGLFQFDQDKELLAFHANNNVGQNPLKGRSGVTSIYNDRSGRLYAGTWGDGLYQYNFTTKNFKNYNRVPDCCNWSMQEDKDENIWIGSVLGSVARFNPKNKVIKKYIHELKPHMVLFADKHNSDIMWAGNQGDGLFKINTSSGKIINILHEKKNSNGLSSNYILAFHQTGKDSLWIGTKDGLNLYNIKTGAFKQFTKKDGLLSNTITGILEDNNGNLWLSTLDGLSKFHILTRQIVNYDESDGLITNITACFKSRTGEMFFSGKDGINSFFPNKISGNKDIPTIAITKFKLFNKEVKRSTTGPLHNHISETKELELSYKESVLTFEFAALNYTLTNKNQYAYKLEGFDKDWNYVGTSRTATYTNLDPGSYVLKVKASNNDGKWNEKGTELKITIIPPFWQTWWFITLSILAVLGSAIGYYINKIRTIRKQQQILEALVKERTAEVVMQKEELQTINDKVIAQSNMMEIVLSEVKESIRAAQVIQQSILPSDSHIKSYLPQSFILNLPKDVVSGDFYWFDVIDDLIIIAAVDCTGHGVSGAFMSITGHHLLNKAVHSSKSITASEILNKLNEGVFKELHQDGKNEDVQDGMDISLCVIDKAKNKMQYAGANNPLYIIRNNQILQIKANKFAIGLSVAGLDTSFKNNEIDLEKDDVFYIFSDGYADQIGGEAEEKFMYPRFRELLISIKDKPFDNQKEILANNLLNWRKEVSQLDDVMVIGFKIV